jgi:NAD(P)H-quinone oxidoreductase subunit I
LKLERYGIGIARGLALTLKTLLHRPITVQYPEQRLNVSRRIRGNELVWNTAKCTICTTCAKSCPQGAIHMVYSADPANPNKLSITKMEVDMGYCISCGICVESCPYNALFMGYAYERAQYRRGELVQHDEQLLASETRKASAYMHPDMEKELPEQTLLIRQIHRDQKIKGKTEVQNPPTDQVETQTPPSPDQPEVKT